MPPSQTVYLACRLRLSASLYTANIPSAHRFPPPRLWRRGYSSTPSRHHQSSAPSSHQPSISDPLVKSWTQYPLPTNIFQDPQADVKAEDGIEVGQEQAEPVESLEALKRETEQHDPELVARAARQAFGDRLPDGALSPDQYKAYLRLYGTPLILSHQQEPTVAAEEEYDDNDILLREGKDGLLEEVDLGTDEPLPIKASRKDLRKRSYADDQLAKDITASFQEGGSLTILKSPDDQTVDAEEQSVRSESDAIDAVDSDETTRAHPFTLASRFGTSPSTLPLPRGGMTEPVALHLSNMSNKHLDEAANRIFGGAGLPYSPAAPLSSRTLPQKPIPINPSQGRMSDITADVYLAAVMPGAYAAVTSALVEVRRRLGAPWLENLLRRPGGPKILDVGAGGAGVTAWREVLRAEWYRMHADPKSATSHLNASDTAAISDRKPETRVSPVPLGRATVLTGSSALRQRASVLLENTTFLPRLPDYVHAQFLSPDSQRKQFDVIVAPYSLWHLQEGFERKQQVLNLWNLLDPKGGVLVLLEKGVPRGFEVIADARNYLLKDLFERSSSMGETDDMPAEEENSHPETAQDSTSSKISQLARLARRAPGHIVAPCPHHFNCPMYHMPGVSRQRKDYCRFSQRYIRPPYLQRMLGAKDRNYDDVEFSYVAVQRGISTADTVPASEAAPLLTGEEATDRAFTGYDLADDDLPVTTSAQLSPSSSPRQQAAPRIRNPLPRLVLPALKRQGHVHLDMCLPSGAFERWTVPRSFGRQAYRDARKARWGDLWPLGAKQRESRRVKLGNGRGGSDASLFDEAGEEVEPVKRGKGAGNYDDDGLGNRGGAAQLVPKARGRLKARRRKRQERSELYGGGDRVD